MNILYSSNINDRDRITITRWRLSCHPLNIETGRYTVPLTPRHLRVCKICRILEDETHTLFNCFAFNIIRGNYSTILRKYYNVSLLLNCNISEDLCIIADF